MLRALSSRVKLPKKIFYGWVLVGLVWVINGLLVGPLFQGMGVFFVVLQREFGWNRTALSFAFSLGRVEGALLGPVEGFLTDKVGVRRIILVGLIFVGLGLLWFSQIKNIVGFYIAFGLIFFGTGLAGFIPLMTAVNHWFVRRRARATALAMTGGSLGGGVLVPVLAATVAAFGFRDTVLWMGVGFLLLSFPITMLIRNKPEDYGLLPDGDTAPPLAVGALKPAIADDGGFTIKEAMRAPVFWAIGVAHGLGAMVFTSMLLHLVPALTDRGISLPMAGAVVSVISFSSAAAQVVGGFLGDKLPKRFLIFVGCFLQGVAMLVAAMAQSVPWFIFFAVLFGFNQMRVPLLVSIRGEYFGRKAFASVLGISQLPQNFLTMLGPVLVGLMFDVTKSYQVAFFGLAVAAFLSAVLALFLRKPVRPARVAAAVTV